MSASSESSAVAYAQIESFVRGHRSGNGPALDDVLLAVGHASENLDVVFTAGFMYGQDPAFLKIISALWERAGNDHQQMESLKVLLGMDLLHKAGIVTDVGLRAFRGAVGKHRQDTVFQQEKFGVLAHASEGFSRLVMASAFGSTASILDILGCFRLDPIRAIAVLLTYPPPLDKIDGWAKVVFAPIVSFSQELRSCFLSTLASRLHGAEPAMGEALTQVACSLVRSGAVEALEVFNRLGAAPPRKDGDTTDETDVVRRAWATFKPQNAPLSVGGDNSIMKTSEWSPGHRWSLHLADKVSSSSMWKFVRTLAKSSQPDQFPAELLGALSDKGIYLVPEVADCAISSMKEAVLRTPEGDPNSDTWSTCMVFLHMMHRDPGFLCQVVRAGAGPGTDVTLTLRQQNALLVRVILPAMSWVSSPNPMLCHLVYDWIRRLYPSWKDRFAFYHTANMHLHTEYRSLYDTQMAQVRRLTRAVTTETTKQVARKLLSVAMINPFVTAKAVLPPIESYGEKVAESYSQIFRFCPELAFDVLIYSVIQFGNVDDSSKKRNVAQFVAHLLRRSGDLVPLQALLEWYGSRHHELVTELIRVVAGLEVLEHVTEKQAAAGNAWAYRVESSSSLGSGASASASASAPASSAAASAVPDLAPGFLPGTSAGTAPCSSDAVAFAPDATDAMRVLYEALVSSNIGGRLLVRWAEALQSLRASSATSPVWDLRDQLHSCILLVSEYLQAYVPVHERAELLRRCNFPFTSNSHIPVAVSRNLQRLTMPAESKWDVSDGSCLLPSQASAQDIFWSLDLTDLEFSAPSVHQVQSMEDKIRMMTRLESIVSRVRELVQQQQSEADVENQFRHIFFDAILQRVRFSFTDATFSARFCAFLCDSPATQFRLLPLLGWIQQSLPAVILAFSPSESRFYAVFLKEILAYVRHVSSDRKKFVSEHATKGAFHVPGVTDPDGLFDELFVQRSEFFRRYASVVIGGLQSSHLHRRISLHLIFSVLPEAVSVLSVDGAPDDGSFAKTLGILQKIKKSVESCKEAAEKAEAKDLQLQAQRCLQNLDTIEQQAAQAPQAIRKRSAAPKPVASTGNTSSRAKPMEDTGRDEDERKPRGIGIRLPRKRTASAAGISAEHAMDQATDTTKGKNSGNTESADAGRIESEPDRKRRRREGGSYGDRDASERAADGDRDRGGRNRTGRDRYDRDRQDRDRQDRDRQDRDRQDRDRGAERRADRDRGFADQGRTDRGDRGRGERGGEHDRDRARDRDRTESQTKDRRGESDRQAPAPGNSRAERDEGGRDDRSRGRDREHEREGRGRDRDRDRDREREVEKHRDPDQRDRGDQRDRDRGANHNDDRERRGAETAGAAGPAADQKERGADGPRSGRRGRSYR